MPVLELTIEDQLRSHSDLIEKLRLSVAIFSFCLISLCIDCGKQCAQRGRLHILELIKKRIKLLNFTEKGAFILKTENFTLQNLLNNADKI